ncbi:hypothetical protein O181_031112 [Austropuccinia psidii MF-1]|uniref:Uncharacterized protein n=1 Tax=Austropuccinia psidii MF-1 TaxID=1389203 RepID=A0A9Q3H518_9BASI|nr:hypothetical protein [Austropuccinia psidii MF-1]
MVEISNGHFNILTYHHIIKEPNHSEDSSRLRASVSASKTNHTIKTSLDNFIHSIPPRQYCSITLKGFKRQFIHVSSVKAPLNPSWQPPSFQAVSIPTTINTASRINTDQFSA